MLEQLIPIRDYLARVAAALDPSANRLTSLITAENTMGAIYTPAKGKFSMALHMSGSPSVILLRGVDTGTLRRVNITGGTALEFTQGTTGWLQNGMYVTGTGVPVGTTFSRGADPTHGTLSQAATNGNGIDLTFWAIHDTYTASQPYNVEWNSSTPWRLYVPIGGLGGGSVVGNFV